MIWAFDGSSMLATLRRLWGHCSSAPSGVVAQSSERIRSPSSPPPESTAAGVLLCVPSFIKKWDPYRILPHGGGVRRDGLYFSTAPSHRSSQLSDSLISSFCQPKDEWPPGNVMCSLFPAGVPSTRKSDTCAVS